MTIYRIIHFSFIFCIALIAGFSSGAESGKNLRENAKFISWPLKELSEDQQNILIISVDQNGSDERALKSVWLMAYYSNSERIDFLPIFPSPKAKNSDFNAAMANSFQLSANGHPNSEFWEELKTVNTWWQGYIVVDEVISSQLLNFLSGHEDYVAQTDLPDIQDIAWWYEDPRASLDQFMALYDYGCQNMVTKNKFTGVIPIIISLHFHMETDLTPREIAETWKVLHAYGESLRCEFPLVAQAWLE